MAWLYLPESLGLISEFESPSHLQEPFVMSKGKPMPLASLCRKWKKGGFIRRLYGLTLLHSTASLGVEKWISSVPDSLVNPGQKLENSRRQKMKDGFGKILKGSFAKYDRNSCSWRTYQVSLTGELVTFSNPWPREGSMLNGAVLRRQKLEQTITEIELSFSPIVPKEGVLFPTISVMDSSQDGSMIRKVAKESLANGRSRGNSLPLCVKLYPTPNASLMATEGSTRQTRKLYLEGKLTLQEATEINQGYNPLKKKGAMKAIYPTPMSSDGIRISKTYGAGNLTLYAAVIKEQKSHQLNALVGGKLNPQWVEWLMGWPIGWTDLGHVETELFHSKQESLIPSLSQELSKGVLN